MTNCAFVSSSLAVDVEIAKRRRRIVFSTLGQELTPRVEGCEKADVDKSLAGSTN